MLDNKGDILEETSGTGDSQAFGIGITWLLFYYHQFHTKRKCFLIKLQVGKKGQRHNIFVIMEASTY